MAVMVLDCPHCASQRMGFDFGGEHLSTNELIYTEDFQYTRMVWNTFWVCRKCRNGVVVQLEGSEDGSPDDCDGDPRDNGFHQIAIHPEPQESDAPEHVPEYIARDFKEAADSLRLQNWTSAGMMFRKVLQRSTTILAPKEVNFTGKTLATRISMLADRHLITPAMKAWADIIRWDGNEATHEEDEVFEEEHATRMRDFTEVFLLYAFTLPGRVEAFSEQTDPVT